MGNTKSVLIGPKLTSYAVYAISKSLRKEERGFAGGFIYAITHPMWPGVFKLGRALSMSDHFSTYQAKVPDRGFELAFVETFENRIHAEEWLKHELRVFKLNPDSPTGEWFDCPIPMLEGAVRRYHSLFNAQGEVRTASDGVPGRERIPDEA